MLMLCSVFRRTRKKHQQTAELRRRLKSIITTSDVSTLGISEIRMFGLRFVTTPVGVIGSGGGTSSYAPQTRARSECTQKGGGIFTNGTPLN